MHLRQLKIFSFHVFLIPIFFVWHVMNEYFGLIPFRESSRFLLYYLGLSFLVFIIGKFLLKDSSKAGCWSAILMIIFFFWGSFHDFLKTLTLPRLLVSYKSLLGVVLIFMAVLTVYLSKRKKSLFKVNSFFTLLFCTLLLLEAIQSGYKLLNRQNLKNNLSYSDSFQELIPPKGGNELKPDIFFIVFDEYASSVSLKKYLGYDNSELDTLLNRHKFYIATDSKSNYNSTPFSIASTFNLNYFDKSLEEKKSIPKLLLQARYTLKKSFLPRWLAKQGYTVKNYGLCDLEDFPMPESVPQLFAHDIPEALYNETLLARLESEIGWNFGISLNQRTKKETQLSYDKNLAIIFRYLNALLQELQTQAAPKFVFGHIQLPHNPYYLNSNGEKRNVSVADENALLRDSLYLDQVKYANRWIDTLANAANKPFQRPRIVIIEGDHGRRDNTSKDSYIRDKQFTNLNSYYFSDKDYSALYDSISPVNSFRVILNKYFQTNLPLLKDSTILLH